MKFYVCEYKPGRAKGETEFSKAKDANRGPAPTCDACGGCTGPLSWLPPYRVELELWDNLFGDLAFGAGGEVLVSERFKMLWHKHGLTGLSGFDPVEVVKVRRRRGRKRQLPEQPNYYRVAIPRSNAAVDDTASGIDREDKPVCSQCRTSGLIERARRILLEPSTWSGEDFFRPRGLNILLVSERIKCLFYEHEFTSAVLIPAEDYNFDFYPEENVEKAQEMLHGELGPTLLEKRCADGRLARYDPRTNHLIYINPDKTVQKCFRPLGGIEYWNRL